MTAADARLRSAALLALLAGTAGGGEVRFRKVVLEAAYRAEGVAVADVNRDGTPDLLTGELWWEGPAWRRHELAPPGRYDPARDRSGCYVNHAADVNGDGWVDSIVIGRPGGPCAWYENPGRRGGHWKRRLVCENACNETPLWVDLFATGRGVLLFGADGRLCAFAPPGRAGGDWRKTALTGPRAPGAERYGHGLGAGDINGDGRTDILTPAGVWLQPAGPAAGGWPFCKAPLGPPAGNMPVWDIDGDGDADVLSCSAHEYGIWWHEQTRGPDGRISFRTHEICRSFSQTHSVVAADVNADGLTDFVTGKRWFAHRGKDPGAREPAVLVWFELRRPAPGRVRFVPHQIDADSGVGLNFQVTDLNADRRPDIAIANKKGVFVFLQESSE